MGMLLSLIFGSKEMRILMLGLDGCGKTTLLYRMKKDQSAPIIPTSAFNVETVRFRNVKFTAWDLGGDKKVRALWQNYYVGTQGLIFVVDSADHCRIHEAQEELHRIVKDQEMRDALILIFANKQDVDTAMKPHEVQEKLRLTSLGNRTWHVQSLSATTGVGLTEGLTWLSTNHRA